MNVFCTLEMKSKVKIVFKKINNIHMVDFIYIDIYISNTYGKYDESRR